MLRQIIVYLLNSFLLSIGIITLPTKTIAVIDYTMSGCYTSRHEKLFLYQKDTTFFVILKSDNMEQVQTELSKDQLNYFFYFLKNCRSKQQIKQMICTNTENYVIQVADETFTLTDASCTWNGFSKLTAYLFQNRD